MGALSIVAVSILGALIMSIVAARATTLIAWKLYKGRPYDKRNLDEPDIEYWMAAAALGLIVSLFSPIAILGYTFRGFLFAPPDDIRLKRLMRQNKELEKQSKELNNKLVALLEDE